MWSNGRDSANNLDCYNEYLLLTFQEHGHYLVLFTHVYATWPTLTAVTLTAVKVPAVTKIRIPLFNFCRQNLNSV